MGKWHDSSVYTSGFLEKDDVLVGSLWKLLGPVADGLVDGGVEPVGGSDGAGSLLSLQRLQLLVQLVVLPSERVLGLDHHPCPGGILKKPKH